MPDNSQAIGGPEANSTQFSSTRIADMRALAHDLSNALEVIIQTSFLLGTLELGENGKQWHAMLESGVERATSINRQLREILRSEI
jgi:hypothetical protein